MEVPDDEPASKPVPQPVPTAPATLADIDALDIKSASGWRSTSGPDFFSDMEPILSKISRTQVTMSTFFIYFYFLWRFLNKRFEMVA